jgi:hypothetical protein
MFETRANDDCAEEIVDKPFVLVFPTGGSVLAWTPMSSAARIPLLVAFAQESQHAINAVVQLHVPIENLGI